MPLEGWEDKRIYVWFEAVMGYFSASVEWSTILGQPNAWKDWWYNPDAKIFNFIGKDNIPFHTVIWPAELMGVERIYEDDDTKKLSLPYDVPANEYMNIKGAQFSKSRNWAIWLPDILERYDPDAIRFYVAFAMPENRDSDFSWSEFVRRNNDELVATWGNLANRVLSFTYKHWDGRVPEPGELRDFDQNLLQEVERGFQIVGDHLESVKIRAALQECFRLAREVNAYLDRAPWFGVIEDDRDAAATTVFTALRAIDSLKILLSPFLPFTCEELHTYLGYEEPLFGRQEIVHVDEEIRSHDVLTLNPAQGSGRWEPSDLQPGSDLHKPKPLFKKLDDSVVESETARLGQ